MFFCTEQVVKVRALVDGSDLWQRALDHQPQEDGEGKEEEGQGEEEMGDKGEEE